VFVQIRLLPRVALPVVLAAIRASLHGTQALVDAFVVVARRPLVVRLPGFPLEALQRHRGFRSGTIRRIYLLIFFKRESSKSGDSSPVGPESCSASASGKTCAPSASTGGPLIGWRRRLRCRVPDESEKWKWPSQSALVFGKM